jgi:hypothetical protein
MGSRRRTKPVLGLCNLAPFLSLPWWDPDLAIAQIFAKKRSSCRKEGTKVMNKGNGAHDISSHLNTSFKVCGGSGNPFNHFPALTKIKFSP